MSITVLDSTGATQTLQTPGVGQKTMANSNPVAIASDQSPVPVSGTVAVNQTTFFNDSVTPLTGSATFTGSARDVGVAAGVLTPNAYFSAYYFADQAGTASIECSNDNSTWRTIATSALVAGTPLLLSVPVMTRYHRTKLVNGGSAQSALMINSAYSGS